jgi:hypothetical protein
MIKKFKWQKTNLNIGRKQIKGVLKVNHLPPDCSQGYSLPTGRQAPLKGGES